jgi:hypothetical protein
MLFFDFLSMIKSIIFSLTSQTVQKQVMGSIWSLAIICKTLTYLNAFVNASLTIHFLQMLQIRYRKAKRLVQSNTATQGPYSSQKLGIYTPV